MLLRPGPIPKAEGWAFELKWDGVACDGTIVRRKVGKMVRTSNLAIIGTESLSQTPTQNA